MNPMYSNERTEAGRMLDNVGLTSETSTLIGASHSVDFQAIPALPVISQTYKPQPTYWFTSDERARGDNAVNRQMKIDGIVFHPSNAIVEYPETGVTLGCSVGHIYSVNSQELYHPRLNIQYSQGDGGGHAHVTCKFLSDDGTGIKADCKNEKYNCKGLKICEAFNPAAHLDLGTHQNTPAEEIFNRTLGFFCTLLVKGCGFDQETDMEDLGLVGNAYEPDLGNDENITRDCRNHWHEKKNKCKGTFEILYDKYERPFLQCQKRSHTDTTHLIIRNLDEFDVGYLRALIYNDLPAILYHENAARTHGFGPLQSSYWHRFPNGQLRRGLLRQTKKCFASFDIYTPYNLSDCPRILIICKNPHSHPHPFPVKTPPPKLNVFSSLLMNMGWKIAEATPRKIMVDSGFMHGLRNYLRWDHNFDPSLLDLHPSLGNMDHARRIVDDIRNKFFPKGTGFEGAQLLVEQQQLLSQDEQYVRCAEIHILEDGKPFHLILCMSQRMSQNLMASEYLSIDTSFKRLHHNWQEFEIESWDVEAMRSVVSVRVFTTSQSAEAHLILFKRIFDIATSDTNIPVHFRHIHGNGFLVWIADAHKGQALGLGMYCQFLCSGIEKYCEYEPSRSLKSLDPYDHLRRFFRLCVTHFNRNIHDLPSTISYEVRQAMRSLSSSEPHPDLEGVFATIQAGGPKAKAWLKDKLYGSKFALPALYQPHSFIPIDIWKASPSTSNGNEQAHRNVNRDGTNLTILGGIVLGMQFDARAATSLELYRTQGIYTRDQEATHFRRYERSINRQLIVQRRTAHRLPVSRWQEMNEDSTTSLSIPTIETQCSSFTR